MNTPAENVIRKMGGPAAVAAILEIDVSNVHRWKYPKERGGQGGLVPSRYQVLLLDAAKRLGLDLGPGDFFAMTASTQAA